MERYDVVVCGGGMAGVAAAVAAAQNGKKVLLVERTGNLGGLATNGMVTVLMSSLSWFSGIGKTLIEGLIEEGGAWRIPDPAVKGFHYYPFRPEAMKRRLEDLILENKTTGDKIVCKCELTDRTKAIVLAGGLLSYTKESLEG